MLSNLACFFLLLSAKFFQIYNIYTGAGASSISVGPFPGNWLAAHIADLTPDLQVLLSPGASLDPNQGGEFVRLDLGPNCLQSFSADDKSPH